MVPTDLRKDKSCFVEEKILDYPVPSMHLLASVVPTADHPVHIDHIHSFRMHWRQSLASCMKSGFTIESKIFK